MQAGADFLETALREVQEELGVNASAEELEFTGVYRGYAENVFYGQVFKNNEISAVYVYRKPVDVEKLKLQKEEVESVKWMDLRECMKAVEEGTMPNCLHMDELRQVEAWLKSHPGLA